MGFLMSKKRDTKKMRLKNVSIIIKTHVSETSIYSCVPRRMIVTFHKVIKSRMELR